MDKQKVAMSTQRMQAQQSAKNQTRAVLQEAAKNYANQKMRPAVSDEQIKKAFAIVDSHTKFLDNLTILNNLNMTVSVISNVLTTNPDWNESEERCEELVRGYMDTFIESDKTIEGDELQAAIREYVVSSCMVHYSVAKRDRELLVDYNSKVNNSILTILKLASQPSTKNQQQVKDAKTTDAKENETKEVRQDANV